MTEPNVSRANACEMPPALRKAQAAIHLPEVQAMLRRLSEYDLGIFMPHQHDEKTGAFQPLHDELIQVESGRKVSFQPKAQIESRGDRYLPVAWRWREGASTPASACEMVLKEGPDGGEIPVQHKMPDEEKEMQ